MGEVLHIYLNFYFIKSFNYLFNIFFVIYDYLVPNVYPVDLFEHLWAVDRLQRLGVSRYFQPEIEECVAYVNRYK